MSLESPVGAGDNSQLGDFIEDKMHSNPWTLPPVRCCASRCKVPLAALTDRERPKCWNCATACWMAKTTPLKRSGHYFNVTRERIRQIEAKALRKLRHPTRSRHLRDYLS